MNNPDKYFRDKLYDLETPLNDRMSFEAVMARRKTGRKVLWWKPALAIIAGLFAVTGAAYLWLDGNQRHLVPEKNRAGDAVVLSEGPEKQDGSANSVRNSNDPGEPLLVRDRSESGAAEENSAGKRNSAFFSRRQNAAYQNRLNNDVTGIGNGGNERIQQGDNLDESAGNQYVAQPSWLAGLFCRKPGLWNFWEAPGALARFDVTINPYNAVREPALPIYAELMVATGGSGYRSFNENADLSIRGNHHFSQYHAVLLADLGSGILAGAGLSYQACMGVAQVRKAEYSERMVVDSHTVVIIQPGLPPRNVVVRDTGFVTDRKTLGSDISYRINKISLPLAFRYQLGQGRGVVRLSATLAPGLVTSQAGTIFNRENMTQLESVRNHALTLDARIGAGMYYQMSRNVAVVAEPMLQWQAVSGSAWKPYSRLGAGFALGVVFRP